MPVSVQQRSFVALLALVAVGLICAVWSLLSVPAVATAADAGPDAETYTWNIAGASYLEPTFFTTDGTVTKYPSNGGAYSLAATAEGDPLAFAQSSTDLAGRGPHGGYDTTTMKCQTCHSAHGADAGVNASSLLRAGSTGCEYCHLGSSVASTKQVYLTSNGNPYDLESVIETASGHQLGTFADVPDSSLANYDLTCGSCHSVHAADNQLWKPTDFYQNSNPASATVEMSTVTYGYKLLKKSPSGRNASGVTTWAATSDPTTDPATINQYAISWWCMDCHDASMTASSTEPLTAEDTNTNPGYLGLTESFETTTFTYNVGAGQITYGVDTWNLVEGDCPAPRKAPIEGVYNGPSQCYNCHRGGLQALADGLNPSDTTQAAQLNKINGSGIGYKQNYATDQDFLDCSTCHYAPADFAADDNRRAGTADWPHSSFNDYKLLGDWTVEPSQSPTSVVELAIPGGMTESNIPQYVCGRCHPTSDGVTFVISDVIGRHYELSIQNVETQNTTGLLGTFYSPGW